MQANGNYSKGVEVEVEVEAEAEAEAAVVHLWLAKPCEAHACACCVVQAACILWKQ